MIHYTHCPLCGDEKFAHQFDIKDYSVSQESFPVCSCTKCGLLFTQDIPSETEISSYYQAEQYISHSDTSKGIVNQLYHLVRKRTLKGKQKLIEKITGKKNGGLLDIGSGTGSFLSTMRAAGWLVTGIEPDEIARKNSLTLHQVEAIAPDRIQGLPDHSYDVITMWHVLEHVHSLDEQLKQLYRLVKDDGKIFIAVPNPTSGDAVHYQNSWAAWDVPRHLYHFSPATMQFLAEKYQFKIISKKPMWFDSFYVSLLSEKYKSGKSNFIKALLAGLSSNWRAIGNTDRCSSVIYILEKKSTARQIT